MAVGPTLGSISLIVSLALFAAGLYPLWGVALSLAPPLPGALLSCASVTVIATPVVGAFAIVSILIVSANAGLGYLPGLLEFSWRPG